jgi:hypothetical protein
MGCPNLRSLAFTDLNSKLLLEQVANEYINHPRGTKKQKNLVFPKFMNGIRMIMAAMKQEFYFIYRNMQKGIGLIL